MKKYWKRFTAWCSRTWAKFKRWVTAILVSLGLVTAALVQSGDVNYERATEYEDGTPLPISEIAETRLYCNDVLVVTDSGADGKFINAVAAMAAGDNVCHATHIATNGLESVPSETIDKRVVPRIPPNAPVLDP